MIAYDAKLVNSLSLFVISMNSSIGKLQLEGTNVNLTEEIMIQLGRLTGYDVSPDSTKIVYNVTYTSIKLNKSRKCIYIANTDGSNVKCLTDPSQSETGPKFVHNGAKIGFLRPDGNGNMQIWEMDLDGTNKTQISKGDKDIEDFRYSPDESKILFIAQVKFDRNLQMSKEIYSDCPESTGMVMFDMDYRHFNEYNTSIPHPFIANRDFSEVYDIIEGEPYEAPMKPFNGIEDLIWIGNDKVAYVSKKKVGVEYASSTNSDIYIYNLTDKSVENFTAPNGGYDTQPALSPDGKHIAWLSMEEDGYESDLNRLFVSDFKTKINLSEKLDNPIMSFCWSSDNETIYFELEQTARHHIHSININTKEIKQITTGDYNFGSIVFAGDKLFAARQSIQRPSEVVSINLATKEVTQVTHENDEIYSHLSIGKVEERWVKTTDGKDMQTWVIYPPNFDESKKYPALLFCQGGPQVSISQSFSFRWCFMLFGAKGYIAILPNRRGLPGFGTEWNDSIARHYGEQAMTDLLTAIDDIKKEKYVDSDKLGCVGASFGGFSTYYLAGHHEKRFKCFVAHAGIFNMESSYYATEEMFFSKHDFGEPWKIGEDNEIANQYKGSPHLAVGKWDTPILVIHGERDFRLLAAEGIQAFNAARLRGIPAEMLIFPDEGHWILKPQNSIVWHRRFYGWLEKYLK